MTETLFRIEPGMKYCKYGSHVCAVELFGRDKNKKDNTTSNCRPCIQKQNLIKYARDKDKLKVQRDDTLKPIRLLAKQIKIEQLKKKIIKLENELKTDEEIQAPILCVKKLVENIENKIN